MCTMPLLCRDSGPRFYCTFRDPDLWPVTYTIFFSTATEKPHQMDCRTGFLAQSRLRVEICTSTPDLLQMRWTPVTLFRTRL